MKTAKILISKLMNERIEHLFPPKVEEKKETKSVSLALPLDQDYVDQEKLIRSGEEVQDGEVIFIRFEPEHDKTYKIMWLPSKGKPLQCVVWECSSFAWRSIGSLATHRVPSEGWSDCVAVQSNLSGPRFCRFCHDAARVMLILVSICRKEYVFQSTLIF